MEGYISLTRKLLFLIVILIFVFISNACITTSQDQNHITINSETSAPVFTANGNVTYTNTVVTNSSGTTVTRTVTTTSIPYFEMGKIVPKSGNNLDSFVPEGWHVHKSATGDINGDKLEDLVMVLGKDDPAMRLEDISKDILRVPRLLVIALKEKEGGYKLSFAGPKVILCRNCGADHDNPMLDLSLKNGTIVIRQERLAPKVKVNYYVEVTLKQNEWQLSKGLLEIQDRDTGDIEEGKSDPVPLEQFYIDEDMTAVETHAQRKK